MIELVGVTKEYELKGVRKVIAKNLDFKFPEDSNVAIMGPNGAGKSTLIRMIGGTELPDRGYIRRSGRLSWPLGFSGGFNGWMTGFENIRFVSRVYGEDTDEVIDYVRNFSELGPSLDLPIRTYSSGMKARLAFGISLAFGFDCYLIDEVIAVGDRKFKMKCKRALSERLETSKIILASHSPSTVKSLCDSGVLLHDNKWNFYPDVRELLKDYNKYC